MRMLEIVIEENAYGSVRPVEVVADAPLSALVPALVEELHLPQTDLSGRKLTYQLRYPANDPGGYILPPTESLTSAGVAWGAKLALDPYVVEDRPPRQPLPASVMVRPDPSMYSSATIADPRMQMPPAYNANNGPVYQPSGMQPPVAYQPSTPQPPYMAPIPPRRSRARKTRRAFLLLGGTALIAGGGLTYAAYRKMLHLPNFTAPKAPTAGTIHGQPTTPAQSATMNTPASIIPKGATQTLVFRQHQGTVRVVRWSPDGMLLASGADDSQVYIWGGDGVVRRDLKLPSPVSDLAWSPDNKRVVIGAGTLVEFTNTDTGAILVHSSHTHKQMVNCVAWTTQNRMQAVTAGDDRRAVVWRTDNNVYQGQTVFARHGSPITSVTWSADGQSIATASTGGTIRVWNAANGDEVHGYYQAVMVPVRSVAFSPRGGQLAAAFDDGNVRIWDGLQCQQQKATAAGNQCVDVPQVLHVSHALLRAVAWSPDGRFLAAGANDGTIAVFYPQKGQQPLFTVKQNNSVHSLSWSPDGTQIAVAMGNVVTLWRLR